MIKKIAIGLSVIFGLAVIILTSTFFYQKEQVKVNAKNEIFYNGKITLDKVNEVIYLYDNAVIKPRLITIKSGGGDLMAGIKLGYFIHERSIAVEVRNYCMSACANYIFLAGSEHIINKKSLVIFHGSTRQKNIKENLILSLNGEYQFKKGYEATFDDFLDKDLSDENIKGQEKFGSEHPCTYLYNNQNMEDKYHRIVVNVCVEDLIRKEDKFYETLGLSNEIPLHGQQREYKEIYQQYKYIGFYYSLETFQKLGVAVKVKGGSWTPQNNSRFNKVYEVTL